MPSALLLHRLCAGDTFAGSDAGSDFVALHGMVCSLCIKHQAVGHLVMLVLPCPASANADFQTLLAQVLVLLAFLVALRIATYYVLRHKTATRFAASDDAGGKGKGKHKK